MYSKSKINEAIRLRKEGFSYRHISLKLSVAKSTLSDWLKDVNFIPNELVIREKEERNIKFTAIKRVDKLLSISKALDFSKKVVGKLSNRDKFILGIGLYIGEGSKVGNFIRIANSDPRIIRFSIMWLKKFFELSSENFKIRIHMYPDNDETKVINFWIKELRVTKSIFQSSYVDRRVNKKLKNKGSLPYGTAHLSVVSNGNKDLGVLLHRKILASIDLVLK